MHYTIKTREIQAADCFCAIQTLYGNVNCSIVAVMVTVVTGIGPSFINKVDSFEKKTDFRFQDINDNDRTTNTCRGGGCTGQKQATFWLEAMLWQPRLNTSIDTLPKNS